MACIDPTDVLGKKFGLLTPFEVERVGQGRGTRLWYTCRCDCGDVTRIVRGNLKRNPSCGCLKHRKASNNPGWTGHGDISGYMWARIRHQAYRKSRTLPFTITLEYVWDLYQKQEGKCALTGWPITVELSSKQKSTRTASLDRIDSSRGYEPGNVQWVHKDVNQMKWTLSAERFIEVCKVVAERFKLWLISCPL